MQSRRQGRLTVITGPMFAGKTSALIAQARRRRTRTLALKPAFDTRTGVAMISSRDHSILPALSVSSWPAEAARHEALVMDEVQFMTGALYCGDVVADVLDAVRDGADVTVSGLDTDYLRQPFDVVARFRAAADNEVVLRACCHVCGKPAAWTAKKCETGHLLEVGDVELYDARCDTHWSVPDDPFRKPERSLAHATPVDRG